MTNIVLLFTDKTSKIHLEKRINDGLHKKSSNHFSGSIEMVEMKKGAKVQSGRGVENSRLCLRIRLSLETGPTVLIDQYLESRGIWPECFSSFYVEIALTCKNHNLD